MALTRKTGQYGLSQEDIDAIRAVFQNHEAVERAILYGSRAMGTYRNNSDIDLVIEGNDLTLKALLQIELEIDDLLLPYKMDLSLLQDIKNSDLRDHIENVGVEFYSANNSTQYPDA